MLLTLLNASGPPPTTAPVHVQNSGSKESTSANTLITLLNVVEGNTLIVAISKTSSTASTWTVTDSKGATWTQRVRSESNGRSFEIWSTSNAAAGHRTITISQSGSYLAYRSVAMEITGADYETSSSIINASGTTQHFSASSTVIDTAADVFVVAGGTANAPISSITPNGSYTSIVSDPTKPVWFGYRSSETALTDERATATVDGSIAFRACIASFVANGLGGTPPSFSPGTVTQDSSGWTVVTPASDAIIAYVSATGNDANDGFTSSTPKATIAAACALLRSGKPDHVLLKRGDTFVDQKFTAYTSGPQGRSAQEPWYFGAYGTGARPKISVPVSDVGISFTTNGVKYLVIQSLELYPTSRSNASAAANEAYGIEVNGSTTTATNVIIEDCYVHGFADNINLKNALNVAVRRNIITDAWGNGDAETPGGLGVRSQGLYCNGVDGLTVKGNFFDHNGYNYDGSNHGAATIYNHNAYLSFTNRNVVWEENFSSRASSHGLKCQPSDGTVVLRNNCHARCGSIGQIGLSESGTGNPGLGMIVTVEDNVFVEGDTTGAAGNNGLGLTLQNIESGTVARNILCNRRASGNIGQVMQLLDDGVQASSYGVHDLALSNNIFYDWRGPVRVLDGPTYNHSGIVFTNNDFQEPNATTKALVDVDSASSAINSFSGGRYYSTTDAADRFIIATVDKSYAQWLTDTGETGSSEGAVTYTAPTRTATTYAVSLGYADYDAFIADVKTKRKGSGNIGWLAQAVNDYIRTGFDKTALGVEGDWQTGTPSGGSPPIISYPADAANFNVVSGTGGTIVTPTASGSGITWTKTGTDAADFSINSSTGALSFAVTPDHSAPTDANADNVYLVTLVATNGDGDDSVFLTVTVTPDGDASTSFDGITFGNITLRITGSIQVAPISHGATIFALAATANDFDCYGEGEVAYGEGVASYGSLVPV